MAKARASKGLLVPPQTQPIPNEEVRADWLAKAEATFVGAEANKKIFSILLKTLWPPAHGLPGPHVSQSQIRQAVDQARLAEGKGPYNDVFRRLRELQGEEGFTSIVKEGTRYQLQSLTVSAKRPKRQKPSNAEWADIKAAANNRCNHCGAQEPSVKLSPDHRVPRARGGDNRTGNWQPLCEQCNNIKSSACQGCTLNCILCHWAYPEVYKPIIIEDDNRERLRRAAESRGIGQSDLANEIIRRHFNAIS